MTAAGPTRDQLREHPQLASLLSLSRQLELLEPVLAASHVDGDTSAAAEQARSMVRVARILHHQVEAYRGLLGVREGAVKEVPLKTAARTRA